MKNKEKLTAYEKKCASRLAHAFYDHEPAWQESLPSFKEVLAVAQELILDESRSLRIRSAGTPLMPAKGFDYVGVEYYLDKNDEDHYHNLRESLKACLKSSYDFYV
jgi:hypothetical protein